VEEKSHFSGCYKQLQVLNISGNSIDGSEFDAKTLSSIFDFVESLEELNLERLKFQSLEVFYNTFLQDFVSNQDYKPYMNTLRKINLNFCSSDFYPQESMAYSQARGILE
jgi:hypothetical protein